MTVKLRSSQSSSLWSCNPIMPSKRHNEEPTNQQFAVHCTNITDDQALISIIPPDGPRDGQRASCDIVLVIDISGSMHSAAPLPDLAKKNSESTGLDILDLVKHASRAILEDMKPTDRLAVVTFSEDSTVVHGLTAMTGHNKRRIQKSIEQLKHEGYTNIWAGIRAGFKVFEDAGPSSNVQGLFILTDGQPNHMCPAQGYVPKMKPMIAELSSINGSVPTIHTFGFGYDIRSGLLQSIAEVGRGSYAFIPDAGMIGTVFIHAIANLYTTCATQVELEVTGKAECSTVFESSSDRQRTLFRLGNLQYGQSRDLLVRHVPEAAFQLGYMDLLGDEHHPQMQGPRLDIEVEYHLLRADLCSALAMLFPRITHGEHRAAESDKVLGAARLSLEDLTIRLRKSECSPNTQSILDDLDGEDSAGQISKALMTSRHNYWDKWGKHYLPSLLHAHARQVCNSFKDPGPLRYGHASPLFNKSRDQLDKAFDKLPAPKPSRLYCTTGPVVSVNMARYHNIDSACFDGECLVRLVDSHIPVADLRTGMKVWTPTGSSTVTAVLKTTPKKGNWMVRIGELWVTPWHPIFVDDEWIFPIQVAEQVMRSDRPVYSVMLASGSSSHALEVAGQICVTMGHDILPDVSPKDVRAHSFFGNRKHVLRSLTKLNRDRNGHHLACGVRRASGDGVITGFVSPSQRTKTARGHCVQAVATPALEMIS